MSSDDSLVWLMKQVTQVARTVGQARRELDNVVKGFMDPISNIATPSPQQQPATRPLASRGAVANPPPMINAHPIAKPQSTTESDPLVIAARNEGIDTKGKTREQIATELAIKLNGNTK
jgi:hypothetical protein